MDFMRKLVGNSASNTPVKDDQTFALLKLRRMFQEFMVTVANSSNSHERSSKLYQMLPLFYEVFHENPQQISQKFSDSLQFSTQLAQLMVSEIKRRALNKSTEEASLEICSFLLVNNSMEKSHGWLLLNVLNLLVIGGKQMVDCMTTMHLPSTLVKCLYLFFDLPPTATTPDANSASFGSVFSPKYKLFTPRKQTSETPTKHRESNPTTILMHGNASMTEKREAVRKVFLQVLLRLCQHISPAEELSHRDDLSLLFSAITSWCPQHNICWRQAAAETLSAISKHGLSHNVIQYIRRKKCIGTCVENMQRSLQTNDETPGEISKQDLAFALVSVIRFVIDTTDVTQLLLDDFKQFHGYEFIMKYILSLDSLTSNNQDHRESIILVINAAEDMTLCGLNEITPDSCIQSPFQTKYIIPYPIGKGASVRNSYAFGLFEQLFIQGSSSFLCCAVLDAILNIYQRDPANYFILSNHYTIPDFAETLHTKHDQTIAKYFSLLEYIAITLGYVPCKELVSLTLLIKDQKGTLMCCHEAIKCLHRIFQHEELLYSQVFRDVGVLEVLVQSLVRYGTYVRKCTDINAEVNSRRSEVADSTMDLLATLVHSSPHNAVVFRDTGGVQCAYNLVPRQQCRAKALNIVEQLILHKTGNDDDMGILLGLLSTVSVYDLQLRMDILRSLLKVISESLEARILFRKVGGFINIISLLVSIEGCLSIPNTSAWNDISTFEILKLLEITFKTLSVALRLPSNRKFFQTEVRFQSLCSSIQYLGCFNVDSDLAATNNISLSLHEVKIESHLPELNLSSDKNMFSIPEHCHNLLSVFKYLFLLATDSFKDELHMQLAHLSASSNSQSRASVPLVLHPNAISIMLQLIALVPGNLSKQIQLDLQYYLINEISWLLSLERNEQILCRSDLVSKLFSCYSVVLADDSHPLNSLLQRIMERLITQASTVLQLREFFRVGRPLHCDDHLVKGSSVSLSRVKNLVSMATPRNVTFHDDFGAKTLLPPAFIEFDMSLQGHGSLLVPNIFPQSMTANDMQSITSTSINGERAFPPPGGITVAAWIYIDKFCSKSLHPIRLLTITREQVSSNQQNVCLSIQLTAKHRRLLISTQEEDLNNMGPGEIEEVSQLISTSASFDTQNVICESQWHHIIVVINKATVLKHSTAMAFVNGTLIGSAKVRYIHSHPDGSPVLIHAFIGTPQKLGAHSPLLWKLASLHVMDESISNVNFIPSITDLGPSYIGNFQAILLPDGSVGSVIPEDRMCFSLHASSYETLSMSQLRKKSSKLNCIVVSKQLSTELSDSLTPVLAFRNCCKHCAGPTRAFGAITQQDLSTSGVRCFSPSPVSKVLQSIGGVRIILSLVSMAGDVESLYAAVKSLVCVIENNHHAGKEMMRISGYQALAMQLCRKKELLNSHVLHLAYSLTGTVHAGQGSAGIPNIPAFQDLLCDFEVWHNGPHELHKSLFEHLLRLMTESSDSTQNIKIMQDLCMTRRCLHFLASDSALSPETTKLVLEIIRILIVNSSDDNSNLRRFGQFLVSTIPLIEFNEGSIRVAPENQTLNGNDYNDSKTATTTLRDITLRNLGIDMLRKCLKQNQTNANSAFCEALQSTLGWDWIVLFTLNHIHQSTVVEAVLLFVEMLWCSNTHTLTHSVSSQSLSSSTNTMTAAERIHAGEMCAGWLEGSQDVVRENKVDSLLGFNVSDGNTSENVHEVFRAACCVDVFSVLSSRLATHAHVPQVYLILLRFAVGDKPIKPPDLPKLDLDTTYQHILGLHGTKTSQASVSNDNMLLVSLDVLQIVLEIVQSIMHQNLAHVPPSSWKQQFPVVILQTLIYIYQFNHANLSTVFATQAFIVALVSTVFHRPEQIDDVASSSLSQHHAKRFVFDLLRMILFDSLSAATSDTQVIAVVFESSPSWCSLSQLKEFQTELISYVMTQLHAADPLLGEIGALLHAGHDMNTFVNIQTNVACLVAKIVDRVWIGMYHRNVHEVFDFISKLVSQALRKSCMNHTIDSLHRSLYRVMFYQLCRRHHTVGEQVKMIDSLHNFISNADLLFSKASNDQLLLPCLAHCLFTLATESYGQGFGIEEEHRQTTWHIQSPSTEEGPGNFTDAKPFTNIISTPKSSQEKGKIHLSKTVAKLWQKIPQDKKKQLEEMTKIQLVDLGGDQANLDAASIKLKEFVGKVWANYLSMERKGMAGVKLPQKLSKKMTSLSMLNRNKGKKESVKAHRISIEDANLWALKHISVVQDLVNSQQKGYKQDLDHLVRYADEEWELSEMELFRERGVWGPNLSCQLHKWMLDSTEGPCRMRKKLTRNDEFYQHYPHRSKQELLSLKTKHKKPISHDSREYYRRVMGLTEDFENEKIVKEEEKTNSQNEENGLDKTITEDVNNITITPDDIDIISTRTNKQHNDNENIESELTNEKPASDIPLSESQSNLYEQDNKPDNQTVLRLLENGERIKHMFRCARVQGLDTYEGLLLFGRENFYIIDGFTMLKSKEIREISSLSPGYHEPIIPQTSRNSEGTITMTTTKHVCTRFSYDDIREVHKRRYLLQDISLEVFSSDGRNYLLVFPQKTRNKVYSRFLSNATTLADNTKDLVAGQKSMVNIEQQGPSLLSNIMGEKTVTQRWERNEISNFQYLMYLNTLAGRSYNDLMQYPVFPWVLADYTSETLDLTNPDTFRDLSKPMGAQTLDRLEQYKKRYKEFPDMGGDSKPCHYTTHYSSAMIVASYLVRMEPFTQHFLRLQGGHFDLADRMFHSIGDSWNSASRKNTADVKELIPEFFYLPDFLLNSNKFDLGQKQNGTKLHDVILPPWAKGSAREFIRMHREALECDYVSAHLHEWIDLIFGFKQQGEAAYEANNVFHHLFYEGVVDIYSISDPLKRNATIGVINNFGQIPRQLFKKPHVQKRVVLNQSESVTPAVNLAPVMFGFAEATPSPFYRHLNNLKLAPIPAKVLKSGVGSMHMTDRVLLAVERNKVLIPPMYSRYLSWGHNDHSIRIGYYESERAMQVFEDLNCGEITCVAVPSDKLLITGGSDSVINIWKIPTPKAKFKTLQLKQSLHAHCDRITCLAACTSYGVLVSGSQDCTCVVWDLNKLSFVRQLRGHKHTVSNIVINSLTGDIFTSSGTYLHMWSINGDPIAKVNTLLINSRKQHITALCVSELNEWDKHSVVATAHYDGYIKFWRLDHVPLTSSDPEDDRLSIKSDVVGSIHRNVDELNFDSRSLDSISIASGQVEGSTIEASSSVDNISRGTKRQLHDATSIVSVGEMTTLPWSDVSHFEVPKLSIHEAKGNESSDNNPHSKKITDAVKPDKWREQLLLEGKVQLIKDRTTPSEPTSIFMSRDLTKLYVGNRKGEIFYWTVAD